MRFGASMYTFTPGPKNFGLCVFFLRTPKARAEGGRLENPPKNRTLLQSAYGILAP